MPEEAVQVPDEHVGEHLCEHSNERFPEEDMQFCEQTDLWYHRDHMVYVEGMDEYVYEGWADDNTFISDGNGNRYPNDVAVHMDNDDVLSERECDERCFQCSECSRNFYNDDMRGDNICEGCYVEEGPSEYREGKIQEASSKYIPELKQRTEDCMPRELTRFVDNHYDGDWEDGGECNRRKPIEANGVVQIMSSNLSIVAKNILRKLNEHNVSGPYLAINTDKMIGEVEGSALKISYPRVDKFGNEKERVEPLAKIFDYACRVFANKDSIHSGIQNAYNDASKTTLDLSWRLSNDHIHKLQFQMQTMSTCQSNGCDQYSKGFADLFTNDCNCLLFVQDGDRVDGRMLCRLFYDDDGKEYLFLDRFYSNGKVSNEYKKILIELVNQLQMKGFNLVVSDISEHGTSNYRNLECDKKLTKMTSSLRQPARGFLFNNASYYSDSGVRTFYNSGRYRDKISSDHLYFVEESNA